MTANTPIVNAGVKYVEGLTISSLSSNTLVTVSAGAARDSTNTNDIILNTGITLNGANVGVNGVDLAAFAISSVYYVYIIGDSTKYRPTAGLMSLSISSPVLPFGYDMFRRIGCVITGSTGVVIPFYQTGLAQDRGIYYVAPRTLLTAGTATTFTAISMSPSMPAIQSEAFLLAEYTPALVANAADFGPYSASPSAAVAIKMPAAALGYANFTVCTAVDAGVAKIVYKVIASDALTLLITGYMDHL